VHCRFASIDNPARKFPRKFANAEAKLLHENNFFVARHGNADDPIWRVSDEKIARSPIDRMFEMLFKNVKNGAFREERFVR